MQSFATAAAMNLRSNKACLGMRGDLTLDDFEGDSFSFHYCVLSEKNILYKSALFVYRCQ